MKTTLKRKYDISIGDKFYYNNFSVRNGHSLPDYLIVTKLVNDISGKLVWIEAKWENHGVYTKERLLSSSILDDSNLNPNEKNPGWLFLKAL